MEDFNKPMKYEEEIDNTNYYNAGKKMCKKKLGRNKKMKTINMTRNGLDAISTLIERSPYLSQILDGSNHFNENCEWTFDYVNNRQAYRLHLPEDKIDILKFLFESELNKSACYEFWGKVHFSTLEDAKKMLKRILKAIK